MVTQKRVSNYTLGYSYTKFLIVNKCQLRNASKERNKSAFISKMYLFIFWVLHIDYCHKKGKMMRNSNIMVSTKAVGDENLPMGTPVLVITVYEGTEWYTIEIQTGGLIVHHPIFILSLLGAVALPGEHWHQNNTRNLKLYGSHQNRRWEEIFQWGHIFQWLRGSFSSLLGLQNKE